MSLVNVHIPRILGNVNRRAIVKRFAELDIGRVYYIDMHKKVNENKNLYYFAFLSIQMYETQNAKNLVKTLETDGIARVIYDTKMNKYWEVKKFVDRTARRSDGRSDGRSYSPDSVVEKMEQDEQMEKMDNDIIKSIINYSAKSRRNTVYSPSIFTIRDKLELADEYMELEYEISQLCYGH
jgi:hypothetical protein